MVRRHDLVWLDPDAPERLWQAAERDAARHWIAAGRPLVAARRRPEPQSGRDDWLSLGFTLPGSGTRRRICVDAAPAAVLRTRAPLALEEALAGAPAAWRSGIEALAQAFAPTGLTVHIYGSLANQILSGEACLHADSDLDLLVDCPDAGAVARALGLLRAHPGSPPRLDGELRLGSGWAVAWRELMHATAGPGTGRVLAKSDRAVALLRLDELLPYGAARADLQHTAAATLPA